MDVLISKSTDGCFGCLPGARFVVFGFDSFVNAQIWRLKSPNLDKGVSDAFLVLGLNKPIAHRSLTKTKHHVHEHERSLLTLCLIVTRYERREDCSSDI